MQVLHRHSIVLLATLTIAFSFRKGNTSETRADIPAAGSSKTFTVPVSYYIKDYSTATGSSWATYPVAVFEEDRFAVRYTVKFRGFKNDNGNEGKTISWKPGALPPSTYHPRQDLKDLIEGKYNIACGATWCNGEKGGSCNSTRAEDYRSFYEENYAGFADITIQY